MANKPKIGLVGYFGWGNFGDELFLKAHQHHLGAEFELEVIHDILEAPYFSRPVEEVVDPCDAILIGGGDLLNPVHVSGLYWKEEFLKKPVFIFGLGVPRSNNYKKDAIDVYRKFFRHPNCKLVVARDEESCNWIKSNIAPTCELVWFPDPVCSLNFPSAMKPQEKTLAVVMRGHRSLSSDLSAVRELIDKAKDMGYLVKHLVLANLKLGLVDLEMARLVAKGDEDIVTPLTLDDMCQCIGSCSLLATIKFHGMVVATMYGIPAIAMSVTPKNRNFLRMIERPEMSCGYTNKDLWKTLSHYPVTIPKKTREWLRDQSSQGYIFLRNRIMIATRNNKYLSNNASANNEIEEKIVLDNTRVSGYQGPLYDRDSLARRADGRVRELPRRLGVDSSALHKSRILEIGCGNGECTSAVIHVYQADGYGVDINPAWEGGCYRALHQEGRLMVMDASSPEITRLGAFDFIHSYTVFEHIEKPRETLSNIWHLLKPGGRAFLSFNLYLGASAGHLLGYLPDLPWIHLTHTDAEIREIMLNRYGINRGVSWVNKWRYQDYLNACSDLGFKVNKCWYVRKTPDSIFYQKHIDTLGKYEVADLSKNFMNLSIMRPSSEG